MTRSIPLHLPLVLAILFAAGCSGRPAAPSRPRVNAAAAGRAAIEMYDTDGNGKLDAAELQRCPALLQALPRADTDGDNALSADEIAARVNTWFASGSIMMDAATLVTLDGQPLEGAEVVFEPEEFLGSGFKECRGATDEWGRAMVTGADANYPGVYVGAYRIRIFKAVGGQETLPARYNTESELGVEVADDVGIELPARLEFHLKSR